MSHPRPFPHLIGLIADDFTGALDSGAQFASASARVYLRLSGRAEGEVELINTASREISEPEAVERVRQACAALKGRKLFKKIDSTLRGHAGAEIQAILDAQDGSAGCYRKAIICPAAPLQGRVTRDGLIYVNGQPLEQTAFKDDPVYPAKTSRLAELIRRPAVHLPLEAVRGSPEALSAAILEAGLPLLSADAETPDDLRAVAGAALATGALPCGAFGLARAYLEALLPFDPAGSHALAECLPTVRRAAGVSLPLIIVVVGSAHPAARRQVQALAGRPATVIARLEASPPFFASAPSLDGLAAQGGVLVLCARQEQSLRTPEWLRFGQTVSEIALDLAGRFRPQALLVVGGETLAYLCRQAQVESIHVLGEAAPGVPYGCIQGGLLHDCLLISKAGSFGDPDTLNQILTSLEEK